MNNTVKELNAIYRCSLIPAVQSFMPCNTDQLTLMVWDMKQLHVSISVLLIKRLGTYSLTLKWKVPWNENAGKVAGQFRFVHRKS